MVINADLSIGYIYARRYDEAEAQARKTLEIDPRSFLAHYYLGMALQLKGRLKEAIPEFQKAVELNHDPYSMAMLAQGYARDGQTDEARKLLAQLNEMAKSAQVPDYALALAYTSLGEKDRAIKTLEHGFAGGNTSYLFLLPGDPLLDDLRERSAIRSARAKNNRREKMKNDNFRGAHAPSRARCGALAATFSSKTNPAAETKVRDAEGGIARTRAACAPRTVSIRICRASTIILFRDSVDRCLRARR